MFEMKAIMEDFRLQVIGGMAGAIDVWEMGICAKLLTNCGSWVACGNPAFRQLNHLQDSYLRMVYSCPPSTPIPALRALAGVWDMETKVALEKVCLVTTILHDRDKTNYAREILDEEISQGWEGITREVQDICKVMGLPDAIQVRVCRKEAKEAMSLHNISIIKKEMEGKSKCDQIFNKDFRKMQDFMKQKSLENARIEVLWLTNMLDTRTTMKAKYSKNYKCPHYEEGNKEGILESPLHLLDCLAYKDLREGMNPEQNVEDRAVYLRKVITRRKELEGRLRTAENI